MTEGLKKLDDVFAVERRAEKMEAGEALALLGAAIRKAATDTSLSKEEIKAITQRAFLITKSIEKCVSDENAEHVYIPNDLLEMVRKDADGPDADVIPISEAMQKIGKRLSDDGDADDVESTKKSDEEEASWGHDLAAGDDEDRVDWGADPPGIRG